MELENKLRVRKNYYGIYEEFPYKENIEDLYIIFRENNLYSIKNYINYYFLKWVLEKRIKINYNPNISIHNKRVDFEILNKKIGKIGGFEREFFNIFLELSKNNNYFNSYGLTKWFKINPKRFQKYIINMKDNSFLKLVESDYIKISKKNKFIKDKFIYSLTEKGNELTEKVFQYKNYIKKFSKYCISKPDIPVEIDNMICYSSIYGISKYFSEEVEKINPDYFNNSSYNLKTLLWLSEFSTGLIKLYESYSDNEKSLQILLNYAPKYRVDMRDTRKLIKNDLGKF
ncbi:MAG: hypothetical protein WAO56_10710 [Miniphocaeibacter sp.]|uniref:hypothetical protein n=1 Tax=Miniphocaeibacter sp. TaxID=3100973 RepID=UPI003BAF11A4